MNVLLVYPEFRKRSGLSPLRTLESCKEKPNMKFCWSWLWTAIFINTLSRRIQTKQISHWQFATSRKYWRYKGL